MNGIYQMDVDSDIWSSLGWVEDFSEGEVPKWLSDVNFRCGIRFVQEFQNAEREIARCKLEYKNLSDWFHTECEAVSHALFQVDTDADLRFYIGLARERLNRLARLWQGPLTKAGLEPVSVTADMGNTAHLAQGAQHGQPSLGQSSYRERNSFDEFSTDSENEDDDNEALSEEDPALLAELDRLYDELEAFEDEPSQL